MVSHVARDDASYNRDEAERLLTSAKESGYASSVVDDAFLYVALHSDRPVRYPWEPVPPLPHWERIVADSVSSGIWFADSDKNRLYFGGTWNYFEPDMSTHIEPFLLYRLPLELITEMFHGRLMIGIFVSMGRLVDALTSAGVDARLPRSDGEFRSRFIPVGRTVEMPTGRNSRVEVDNLHWVAAELLYHFLGLQAFAYQVAQMLNTAAERAMDKAQMNEPEIL